MDSSAKINLGLQCQDKSWTSVSCSGTSIDNQVKIRGFRIELGEIEAILVQHPTVQENAVIVHELESGDKRLVTCLVPNQGQTIDYTELRAFLKDRLPDYMIPKVFITIDTLPLGC